MGTHRTPDQFRQSIVAGCRRVESQVRQRLLHVIAQIDRITALRGRPHLRSLAVEQTVVRGEAGEQISGNLRGLVQKISPTRFLSHDPQGIRSRSGIVDILVAVALTAATEIGVIAVNILRRTFKPRPPSRRRFRRQQVAVTHQRLADGDDRKDGRTLPIGNLHIVHPRSVGHRGVAFHPLPQPHSGIEILPVARLAAGVHQGKYRIGTPAVNPLTSGTKESPVHRRIGRRLLLRDQSPEPIIQQLRCLPLQTVPLRKFRTASAGRQQHTQNKDAAPFHITLRQRKRNVECHRKPHPRAVRIRPARRPSPHRLRPRKPTPKRAIRSPPAGSRLL